jgi:6-phosphogluconolactonase (cycloisomerase 2 family)
VKTKTSTFLACATTAALGFIATRGSYAEDFIHARDHAVFVMTNDANSNEIVAFERYGNGALREAHSYKTGGRGSGGTVDPLTSQGSLTLSDDGNWLFAVNAGSGTLSLFRVEGSRLFLTDQAPTEGSEPNAVAQHGNFVYVLNTAGSSNVVGFSFNYGHLQRINDSLRLLSGNGVGSASIAFSPDGTALIVTERATNSIDVFNVLPDGHLSSLTLNPSAAPGVFAATFAPNGTVVVSETGPGGPNASTVSSYRIGQNRTLAAISAGVPTLGTANCWNAITPDGKFAYVSNSGSASISGFAIAANGALSPLPGTVVANNPPGSANLDIAISADGAFLFTLNAVAGDIGVFAIDKQSGALRNVGSVGDLPAGAGLNGIAAN